MLNGYKKKEICVFNERNIRKNEDGAYNVCTMGNCLYSPCQSTLHVPKRRSHLVRPESEENKIRMIIPVRIHLMGCQEGCHMSNFSCSHVLWPPESV